MWTIPFFKGLDLLLIKTQMSSFLETFNEHPKQFILVYLGGFRERNNYTLKTFFINTLLTLLILKY
jgi:hypothetical protein|tara:strand:- start:539 stop:736 length:198 start_codon:yes stop_codon:yes gene_type:complete